MIALPQRLARRLEAQALEAGFDLQVLQRKVGGVNGKEVTDPRIFTSLFSPSLSQTALMPQKSPQCLWMPTDTSRTRRLSRNLVDHTSWGFPLCSTCKVSSPKLLPCCSSHSSTAWVITCIILSLWSAQNTLSRLCVSFRIQQVTASFISL